MRDRREGKVGVSMEEATQTCFSQRVARCSGVALCGITIPCVSGLCAFHTPHFTLHTLHSPLYTPHFPLHILHSKL